MFVGASKVAKSGVTEGQETQSIEAARLQSPESATAVVAGLEN